MILSRIFAVASSLLVLVACAAADDAPRIEPLLPELVAPAAIAIRPDGTSQSYELYVADGERILRVASDALDQPQEIVTGNKEAAVALLFLNHRTIVVALDGAPPILRGYEIPDADTALPVRQAKFAVRGPARSGPLAGIARGPTALFAVDATGDAGQIWRSRVRRGVPGDLKPFVACGPHPTCAAISPRGWLVVGAAGESNASNASRLTFYHPTDATAPPALAIKPGLLDIAAIAYGPRDSLYVADAAQADPPRAGIYRIDMVFADNTIAGKAVLIVPLPHPTALACAPDGTLYAITRTDDKSESKLLRVTQVE